MEHRHHPTFFYPSVCAFLVPIAIRNYKGVEILLIIWSLFVLMASFKGYWQKIMVSTPRNSISYIIWVDTVPILSGLVSVTSPVFQMQPIMEYMLPWPPLHSVSPLLLSERD